MTKSFKPNGYHSVNPYLITKDANRLVEFLKQAFYAEELERDERPDGTMVHVTCRIGDSMIGIGGSSNEKFPPMKNALHVYVENADEVYERALQAGAHSLYEPQDHEYGERSGGVEDPSGNHWYIATNISR